MNRAHESKTLEPKTPKSELGSSSALHSLRNFGPTVCNHHHLLRNYYAPHIVLSVRL